MPKEQYTCGTCAIKDQLELAEPLTIRLTKKEYNDLRELCAKKDREPDAIVSQALYVYNKILAVNRGDIPGGIEYVDGEYIRI